MMTYYLRDKHKLPSAAVALRTLETGKVLYAIAAWNSKADAGRFLPKHSRELAMRRVELERVKIHGAWILDHKHKKVGSFVAGGERVFRRVLVDIVETRDYPQRVREAAKRTLKRLEQKDAADAMRGKVPALLP